MAELPTVTREYFQILVVRELRKAGFEVGDVRVHRRTELDEPQSGFVVELLVPLALPSWHKRALVACRREEGAVGREVVESLADGLAQARADVGIVFSTADFGAETVAAAQAAGVAVLHVADSRSVYDSSGWGTAGHYPAWLPAHMAQVVDLAPGGQVRIRSLESGQAGTEMILAGLAAPS